MVEILKYKWTKITFFISNIRSFLYSVLFNAHSIKFHGSRTDLDAFNENNFEFEMIKSFVRTVLNITHFYKLFDDLAVSLDLCSILLCSSDNDDQLLHDDSWDKHHQIHDQRVYIIPYWICIVARDRYNRKLKWKMKISKICIFVKNIF